MCERSFERTPTCFFEGHLYGPGKFGCIEPADFCNKIGPSRSPRPTTATTAFWGGPAAAAMFSRSGFHYFSLFQPALGAAPRDLGGRDHRRTFAPNSALSHRSNRSADFASPRASARLGRDSIVRPETHAIGPRLCWSCGSFSTLRPAVSQYPARSGQ
jgi:hypothetical protein